ncbi:[Pyruvate dehydrogenase (acetyl-transferring)] kinase 1, mitochondrial [[Candida] anglica]|uniref:Protein-serine/threonine kinase n=1 Tax=[Candida] anglica TaxID=148631 RepID=A0ABP0EIH8_9ASCO
MAHSLLMRFLRPNVVLRPGQRFIQTSSVRCNENVTPPISTTKQEEFLREYRIRSTLERLIHHYSSKPLPQFSLDHLYKQSTSLDKEFLLQNAQDTVTNLLIFNARRLQSFRTLPYLVVLNPSISEAYNMYLQSMSLLIGASYNLPTTLEENERFCQDVVTQFIEIHADTLPGLSKGFSEVLPLLSTIGIEKFLGAHLTERIRMRLVAHQHNSLTASLSNETEYVPGGRYNGVIKQLNIEGLIKRNADMVNDITLMKYDQSVNVSIDTNFHPTSFWSKQNDTSSKKSTKIPSSEVVFPYIDYHLEYILRELFKNSFRAHIENNVTDPVQVTISVSESPSYMELRIRDKGKGIPKSAINHMFDYSFSTYESGEGEAYKTLNVPPGLGGNTVAGMGYGLPLSKNYIEVFNETQGGGRCKGSLSIQTYPDWGTDVYLKAVGV